MEVYCKLVISPLLGRNLQEMTGCLEGNPRSWISKSIPAWAINFSHKQRSHLLTTNMATVLPDQLKEFGIAEPSKPRTKAHIYTSGVGDRSMLHLWDKAWGWGSGGTRHGRQIIPLKIPRNKSGIRSSHLTHVQTVGVYVNQMRFSDENIIPLKTVFEITHLCGLRIVGADVALHNKSQLQRKTGSHAQLLNLSMKWGND